MGPGKSIERRSMNPFGVVLLELLEARGIPVAELVERISQSPGAPEISGDELLAIMTSEPGEEFRELMAAFDEAVLYEN
jgi:hypothetical protein